MTKQIQDISQLRIEQNKQTQRREVQEALAKNRNCMLTKITDERPY